mgnify:CR=1 FL=1
MDLCAITISSPRLRLASFRPSDVDEMFAAVTPSLTRFTGFDPAPSPEALAQTCAPWPAAMAEGRSLHLVVRRSWDGEFLGMTGLHRLSGSEPVVGIWIKEEAQRHGFGRETVETVGRWAGELLGCAAVLYPVAEENRASRAIPEGLGGAIVGHSQATKADGRRLDLVTYRIPIGLPGAAGEDDLRRRTRAT